MENPNQRIIDRIGTPDEYFMPANQRVHQVRYTQMRRDYRKVYWDPKKSRAERMDASRALDINRVRAYLHEEFVMPFVEFFRR